MIHALIWDADGTLFDTYPPIYRSIELALATFDIVVPREEIIRLTQIDMPTCFITLAKRHNLAEQDLITQYREARVRNSSDQQPLFSGLRQLCEWFLAQGGKHYIVTHRDRLSLLRLLEHNECTAWFTDIITANDDFPRKPDPEGLIALMARNDLDPSTTMFVGDRDLDIKAAKNASIRACQFGEALTNTLPDIKITRYEQLLAKLILYNK